MSESNVMSTFHAWKKTGLEWKKTGMEVMSQIHYEFVSPPPTVEINGKKRFIPPSLISLKRTEGSSYSTSTCTSTADALSTESSSAADWATNSTITSRPSIMMQSSRQSLSGAVSSTKQKKVVFVTNSHEEGEEDLKKLMLDNTSAASYDDDDDDDDDQTRALSLMWDEAAAVARRRGQTTDLKYLTKNNEDHCCYDTFLLPPGITKSDIMVTVDIDDEARSSRAQYMDEDDMDVIPRRKDSTDTMSINNTSLDRRRQFEETIRQGMTDDLRSMYTATSETAKLVLCVVICVLSDGTMEHTFWSGGRVGLAEIALNWRLFGADDLKLYHGGLTVQRKDFGFGPIELTEAEGQYILDSKLAPRATNDIVRQIGDVNEDFLAEV